MKPGVDYDQTYSAAMRPTSLRLMSSLAARCNLNMRRWDFVSAYLQGDLLEGETVYCYSPPGYPHTGSDGERQIVKVVRPIYGMAQAGRRWQRTLFPWLLEDGFTQCSKDPCVFFKRHTTSTPNGPRDETLIVGVYVDDLYYLYSHDDEHSLYRQHVKRLTARWEVEDEGEVSDLLGVDIAHNDDKSVTLSQPKYIDKMVNNHLGSPPAQSVKNKLPCDSDLPQLTADALLLDPLHIDPALRQSYQSIVGALLYAATNTRPDISYATGMLCRTLTRPTPALLDAARRVLEYLHRTRTIGLRYVADDVPLAGMSDSDWGVKRSTSGYVFRYNQAAISWGSKKQPSVALSSCEAEIMAASEAAKEAIFLRDFLDELGYGSTDPTPVSLDNKGAIDLSYNPEHHVRTKHIDRRHYFIREKVEEMQLRVPYVNTTENLADFFTKPLTAKIFYAMRDAIMNVPPPPTAT